MRQPLRASVAFELAQVAAHTGATIAASSAPSVTGVATDSRDVRPGDLFVARTGLTADGHRFAEAAVTAGAVAILAERPLPDLSVPVLLVEDATQALGQLANANRRRLRLRLVAVTGSNGKTTTKEMLASILAEHAGGAERVLATRGNFNNHVGLPLTLLAAQPTQTLGVVELGMSGPGEIDTLARLAEPDVGVVTNAARAHLEGLGSVEAVARAKAELWGRLAPGGCAVVPADDPLLLPFGERFDGEKIRFGQSPASQVRILAATSSPRGGLDVTLRLPGGSLDAHLPLLGRHNALNAAAAAAAALSLEVPIHAIGAGLERVRLPGHRARLLHVRGAQVLDDCYNANPDSLLAALDTLGDLPGPGRRCAVLGDLLELGEATERLHRALGREVARRSIAALIGVGEAAAALCQEARDAGVETVHHVSTATEAIEPFLAMVHDGDRWLIKGSRGVGLDRLVRGITETPGNRGAA